MECNNLFEKHVLHDITTTLNHHVLHEVRVTNEPDWPRQDLGVRGDNSLIAMRPDPSSPCDGSRNETR